MKTIVTLKRFYYKEVEIEFPNSQLTNKSPEEIGDFIVNECTFEAHREILFDDATLEYADEIEQDTDRYDIYDKDNNQIYGGHL